MIASAGQSVRGVLLGIFVLLTLSLTLGSCTTFQPSRAEYTKDGVEYGVTKGPFRGRWWSYYERGRSYQEGGFLKEAEEELRIALQSRRKDGLWPRTYGMHFIPEYFPHRELGINLFLQGDVAGSIEELETSLAHQYSARAADYYQRAQREQIKNSGGDAEPPTLEVLTRNDNLSATRINFEGIARDDTFVTDIEVNGTPFDIRLINDAVSFNMTIDLAPGQNSIPVRITDVAGKAYQTEVVLNNDVDGPAISFDPVAELPGVISGKVFDLAGVEFLRVGGNEARLRAEGPGLAAFEVTVATPESSLPFVSTDKLGNTTRGELPVGQENTASVANRLSVAAASPALAAELLTLAGSSNAAASIFSSEPVKIDLENLLEGAEYYQDEIVVALRASSKEPIAEVTLRGEAIPIIPARNEVYVTRRESLTNGANVFKAAIADSTGNSAETQRTVMREQNDLEITENMLAVALLAAPDAPDEITNDVIDSLYGFRDKPLFEKSREHWGEFNRLMDRFDFVDRKNLDVILREQLLSANMNTSSDRALKLGEFIPFEVLLSVQAKIDNDTLEIIIDGVSSETGSLVTGRVEVSGPIAEADEILRTLALRLLQEFPRSQGEITYLGYPDFDSTLTQEQGVRRDRKCLVFRLDAKVFQGVETGVRPTIVAEGRIKGVSTSGGDSSAEFLKALREDVSLKDLKLEDGYYVVLK